MRLTSRISLALVTAIVVTVTLSGPARAADAFTVTSPGLGAGNALAARYTCDGAGTSPPLSWANPPKGTKGYAVVMDHVPPDGGHHWYWLNWGIPSKTRAIPANSAKVGYLGGNSVNKNSGYAPPCSQGPGSKTYTITLFALSGTPNLPKKSSAAITRDALLSAISNITITKAALDVTYTR
ncbi:MAG: YbhB/YbcL family Raf kinase inhibitor-like protein [Candidatus Nanopelagicales bacterium]